MKLKIISRKSALAQIQANQVAKKILDSDPSIEIDFILKETQGDIDLSTPLHQMKEPGVFSKDIKAELLNGNADIAIHSWKDLPVDLDEGTEIIGTINRADMRDMLFLKKTSKYNNTLNLFSSSPRRERNLKSFLPKALPGNNIDIDFHDIRGNILTRFKKLQDSSLDGLIVAKAAIDRLINDDNSTFLAEQTELKKIIEEMAWMILPLSVNPCAAAQGAIAIEAKSENTKIRSIIDKLSDKTIFQAAQEEREILKSYGGGCHQKIGVSLQQHKLGEILNVIGETEEGLEINMHSFRPKKVIKKFFKGASKESIYPQKNEKPLFFKRKPIKHFNEELSKIDNAGIYISRSNALDSEIFIKESNYIWASGIETWLNLAKSGKWVNGCSDSLGEEESPANNPFSVIKWYKLSHNNKINSERIISTYELIPLKLDPSIAKKTHFFWMSASSFERAIEEFPEILNAKHASGLGKSFDIIESHTPGNVQPFLDYQDWLNQLESNCPSSF
tara:strand:+ start:16199 stop:17710 length:1512 start_codon:yes stop_codon:yes gene_type:complete